MLHPDTELRFVSDAIGYGVVATRLIRKGTITWVMDDFDQRFSAKEVERMSPAYKQVVDKYTFRDNTGDYILCWDHARYINHSFRANCVTTAYDFELAVRNIRPGEELTDDYGFLNLDEPFDCLPERGTRRTRVNPDDLLRQHKKWDRMLDGAFRRFRNVDQPLYNMLPPTTRAKAVAVAEGSEPMDSILNCYYPREDAALVVAVGRMVSRSHT